MSDIPPLPELVAVATAAARTGAWQLGGAMRVTVRAGHNDVVTDHDLAAERAIHEVLRERTPGARILGEEGTSHDGGGRLTWHIDPIDGTSNYASGAPLYCVSIGATVNGRPRAGVVLDPVRDEVFATEEAGVTISGIPVDHAPAPPERDAVLLSNFPYEGVWFDHRQLLAYGDVLRRFRGIRRLGSAALALAWVAAGRASVACELRTNPWDHAAGAALVLAAGGSLFAVDHAGEPTDDMEAVSAYVAAGPGFTIEGSILERLITHNSTNTTEGKHG